MVHAFADCELDEALFQLRVQGRIAKVEPKVFDVLLFLLRRRDRVVTKDELLDGVWSGESVSESVLPHCIAAARRAVGDDRAGQRVIRTVHGRGYRFVAEVRSGRVAVVDTTRAVERPLFVGREAALARLRAGLDAACAGAGATALLVGEPGIGKTRTAQELAREAEARGARVVWGRCVEAEGAPAFWPWTQVLRGCARDPVSGPSPEELGPDADVLARLVGAGRPGPEPARDADTEGLRFRLFDAVAGRLLRAAREQPLVVVLDDLHWADPPSLRLVEFLAPELRGARILLLATFRDVELRRGHPLARLLGALAREPSCERVVLRGLAPEEIARWVAAAVGEAGAPELAATLHEMTEGNPFFVQELLRLVAAGDPLTRADVSGRAALALPQSVRDAIGRRLDALSPACDGMLRAAAVVGRAFGSRDLAAVLGEPAEALLDRLAEATAAGVLSAAEDGLGRFAFRHALLRQTLYEEIPTPQRVALHRRAGLALEELHAADPEPYVAALAHHFYEAAPGGEAERAISYARAAAARAQRQFAYEEAARQLARALDAETLLAPPDDARRGELLLALGEAQSGSGERELARASFLRAAVHARRRGDAAALARAAVGHKGPVDMGLDDGSLALLEEALAATGEAQPVWRARVLSRLVGTPPHSSSMARREALSREALALAEASGDPLALADALNARYWAALGPDHSRERLEVASALRALAERTGDTRALVLAGECAYGAALVLGDAAGARAALDAWERAATALRQPGYQFIVAVARASWALTQGRFAEAESRLAGAVERGGRTFPYAALLAAGHGFWLRYVRGDAPRLEGLDALVEGLVALPSFRVLGRCATLLGHLFGGDLAAARRAYDELAAHGFADLERDENWLLAMGMLTDGALWLRDEERAALLVRQLEPYADLMLAHELVRAVSSTVANALGALSSLLGRHDEAEAWLVRGIAKAEAMAARPAVVNARASLARALERRGRPGDRRRARAEREAAESEARALGMRIEGRHPWLAHDAP